MSASPAVNAAEFAAGRLGSNHGDQGVTPFGDLGDGFDLPGLMTAAGYDGDDHDTKVRLAGAYTAAWEYVAGRAYDPAPIPPAAATRVRRVAWLVTRAITRAAKHAPAGEVLTATGYDAGSFAIRHDGHWYRVAITDAGPDSGCSNCGGGPDNGHQDWCGTAPGKMYDPARKDTR